MRPLAAFLCLWAPRAAAGHLLGAAVLPHGDFALDPSLLGGRVPPQVVRAAEELHRGSVAAGAFVAGLGADVLVLTTPHGIASETEALIYGNSALSGSDVLGHDVNASFGGSAPGVEVGMEAVGDAKLARDVYEVLRGAGAMATLLGAWADSVPLPLRWGEVFPLRFVAGGGELAGPRLLVLSLPTIRHTKSGAMLDEYREMGQAVARALTAAGKTFAVVVSTDLSHRHWANSTYGAHPLARPFDEGCGEWARTLDYAVLQRQSSFVDEIYSCGWLGLPFLQGAMDASGARFQGELLAPPVAPTYYGMMASTVQVAGTAALAEPDAAVLV